MEKHETAITAKNVAAVFLTLDIISVILSKILTNIMNLCNRRSAFPDKVSDARNGL